jgi:hypothetical protein
MNTFHTSRPVAIAVALFSIAFTASVAAVDSGGAMGAAQSSKPALTKGMSAATVRQLIGDPIEVRKIETDGASGETWIYHRDLGTEVTQEAVLIEQVPAYVGPGYGDKNNTDLVDAPAQRLKRTTRTQVTALLMVEDTLVFARQWVERAVAYDN